MLMRVRLLHSFHFIFFFPLIYICARTRVHLLLEKVSFRNSSTIGFNRFVFDKLFISMRNYSVFVRSYVCHVIFVVQFVIVTIATELRMYSESFRNRSLRSYCLSHR